MQKPPGAKPSKPKGAFTLARYYCSFYVLPLLSLIFTQPQGSRILRATGTTVKSPFCDISPKYVGDTRTWGNGDMGTRGHGDMRTWGHWDMGTRGHGDTGTWGLGDMWPWAHEPIA